MKSVSQSRDSRLSVVVLLGMLLAVFAFALFFSGGMARLLPTGQGYEQLLETSSIEDEFLSEEEFGSAPPRFTNRVSIGAFRGARLAFVGDCSADNATATYRVWSITPVRGEGRAETHARRHLLCFGTLTFSTGCSVPSSFLDFPVSEGWYFADTITVTTASASTDPAGIGEALLEADGGGQQIVAYSPAGGAYPGELIIPDLFDADSIYVELVIGTNCTKVNAVMCPLR